MKGYLTIFMSLSLSILSSFILFLTQAAIYNQEKLRFECAVDTSMNAALSEYHIGLFKKYGLLYVDTAYLGDIPSIKNTQNRLEHYLYENTDSIFLHPNAPWGKLTNSSGKITEYEAASSNEGASIRNQAIKCNQHEKVTDTRLLVTKYLEEINVVNQQNTMEEWKSLMEQINGMELPKIRNSQGILEEVPLNNPADDILGMTGIDLLSICETHLPNHAYAKLITENYISCYRPKSKGREEKVYQNDKEIFLQYIFSKMGYLQKTDVSGVLAFELEYIAKGEASDYLNLQSVCNTILKWRFADNTQMAMSDSSLYGEALEVSSQLHAVQLKEEFLEPVATSLLYACAYLESIADLKTILTGGGIPLCKGTHNMSLDHVINHNIYTTPSQGELSYKQYLACMLMSLNDADLSFRVMDIMEMNLDIHMEGCIESFEAELTALGSCQNTYKTIRRYGFY